MQGGGIGGFKGVPTRSTLREVGGSSGPGTPLIISGPQFHRVCHRSWAELVNMARKVTSDLGKSCFDSFVYFTSF